MRYIFYLMVLSFALAGCKRLDEGSINPIIGNISAEHFYTPSECNSLTEKQRIGAHLSYAYQLLKERTEAMPESEIKQKRFVILEHLRNYIRRGEFPINSKYEERRPCFIDEKGTYCAVGYLIQQTAGSALAEKINSLFQYEFLSKMQLPELSEWVSLSGFSVEEMATIQPTYGKIVVKNSITVGGGMSYRGLNNGYPSFRLSYGGNIKDKLRSLHGRMEMVGQNDFYSTISYGYAIPLSTKKAYLRNRRIGAFIGTGLLVEEGKTSWMLKPEIQLNIFNAFIFKRFDLAGVVGYAYDISLNNESLFPTNRNDFSFHLILSRTKVGVTY
ncbi:MAG: hypothetical protein ACK4WD_13435 [Flavobacteriales bacterium]|jgi:hypothetical protein